MWIGEKNPKDNRIRFHFFPNTWWIKFCAAIACFYTAGEMVLGIYKTPESFHRDDIFTGLIYYLSKEPISWMAPLFMVGLGFWCLYLSLTHLYVDKNRRPKSVKR